MVFMLIDIDTLGLQIMTFDSLRKQLDITFLVVSFFFFYKFLIDDLY